MAKPQYFIYDNVFCINPSGQMRLVTITSVRVFDYGLDTSYVAYDVLEANQAYLLNETRLFRSVDELIKDLQIGLETYLKAA